jgi:hypothetical protein
MYYHYYFIIAADSGVARNLRRGERLRLRFWKGAAGAHTYPFALSRLHLGRLQLDLSSMAFYWFCRQGIAGFTVCASRRRVRARGRVAESQ